MCVGIQTSTSMCVHVLVCVYIDMYKVEQMRATCLTRKQVSSSLLH